MTAKIYPFTNSTFLSISPYHNFSLCSTLFQNSQTPHILITELHFVPCPTDTILLFFLSSGLKRLCSKDRNREKGEEKWVYTTNTDISDPSSLLWYYYTFHLKLLIYKRCLLYSFHNSCKRNIWLLMSIYKYRKALNIPPSTKIQKVLGFRNMLEWIRQGRFWTI